MKVIFNAIVIFSLFALLLMQFKFIYQNVKIVKVLKAIAILLMSVALTATSITLINGVF